MLVRASDCSDGKPAERQAACCNPDGRTQSRALRSLRMNALAGHQAGLSGAPVRLPDVLGIGLFACNGRLACRRCKRNSLTRLTQAPACRMFGKQTLKVTPVSYLAFRPQLSAWPSAFWHHEQMTSPCLGVILRNAQDPRSLAQCRCTAQPERAVFLWTSA